MVNIIRFKPLFEDSSWLMLPNKYHSEQHHHTNFSTTSELGWQTRLAKLVFGDVEEKCVKICFLNVCTNQVHSLALAEDARGKTVCGFSAGWLILLDHRNSSLTLLNPFTGHGINNLPQLPKNGAVHKAILSADPLRNPRDYKVLAILGEKRKLLCYEDGDKQWTMLQDYGTYYDDVLAPTDDELVAVSELGSLVCCDSPNCNQLVPPCFFNGGKVYLVSLGGEIYMLKSFSGTNYFLRHEQQWYDNNLRRFEVYRYDERHWCRTEDLGKWTIFLGHNHSIAAFKAQDFRPNCIYFTDDEGGIDYSGVFSLRDGEAERHQWFMPSTAGKVVI